MPRQEEDVVTVKVETPAALGASLVEGQDLRDMGKMLRKGVGKQGWVREEGDVCLTAAMHHPLLGLFPSDDSAISTK